MVLSEKGYNSQLDFTLQVNLLFIFSLDKKLPLFYRMLPGNVRDISFLKSTIEESGIKDVVVIGDKGFYSKDNIKLLEKENLRYILPLKRNNWKIVKKKILQDISNSRRDIYGITKVRKQVMCGFFLMRI